MTVVINDDYVIRFCLTSFSCFTGYSYIKNGVKKLPSQSSTPFDKLRVTKGDNRRFNYARLPEGIERKAAGSCANNRRTIDDCGRRRHRKNKSAHYTYCPPYEQRGGCF